MHIARAFDRGLARLQPPPPYLPSNKPPPRAEKTYLEEVTFSSRPWGVLRIREKSKIAYMGTARMSMPLPPNEDITQGRDRVGHTKQSGKRPSKRSTQQDLRRHQKAETPDCGITKEMHADRSMHARISTTVTLCCTVAKQL